MSSSSEFTDKELIDLCFNFNPERIGYSEGTFGNQYLIDEDSKLTDRMPSELRFDGEWITFQFDDSGTFHTYNIHNPACVRLLLHDLFIIEADAFFNPEEYPDLLLENCSKDRLGRFT